MGGGPAYANRLPPLTQKLIQHTGSWRYLDLSRSPMRATRAAAKISGRRVGPGGSGIAILINDADLVEAK
jgi:hypothetical protein